MDKFIPKDKHIFTEKILGKSDREIIYALISSSDKSIFVFGGNDDLYSEYSAEVHRYDISEGKWRRLIDAPIILRKGIIEKIDNDMFIIGAGSVSQNEDYSLVYNTKNDSWRKISGLGKRREGLISGTIDGSIYIVSSYGDSDRSGKEAICYQYNIKEDTVKIRNNLIVNRSFVMSVVIDGYLYVLSMVGTLDLRGKCTHLSRYYPTNNLWEDMPNMPRPRYESVAVAIDSKIFILCGRSNENYITVDYFDTRTRKWTISDIPTPQINSPGVVMVDNKIYLVGGKTRAGEYNKIIYEITYEGMKE